MVLCSEAERGGVAAPLPGLRPAGGGGSTDARVHRCRLRQRQGVLRLEGITRPLPVTYHIYGAIADVYTLVPVVR